MSIEQEVQKSETSGRIDLFDLDFSTTNEPALAGQIFRCTPAHVAQHSVVFNGNEYQPFPIELSGISFNSDGAPPRPQLSVSNLGNYPDISHYLGSLALAYGDLVNTTVVYTRTFATFLGGAGAVSMPPLKFYISKRLPSNRRLMLWELRDPRDKERAYMPKRQMLRDEFPGLGVNKRVG